MVVLDLDGTLARSDQSLSLRSLNALEQLGQRGIPRVIATGRSLYATRKILTAETPFDYLIFSTGAGTAVWPSGHTLASFFMEKQSVESISALLQRRRLDYMLHAPIPDNHHFQYFGEGKNNPDFHERIRRGEKLAVLGSPDRLPELATQFLVVATADSGPELFRNLKSEFRDFSVVRATSPLDQHSIWIEIFPGHVSKGNAARDLAAQLQIPQSSVLAIGNDYNDLDLLAWAGSGYLLSNSPLELQSQYPLLPTNDDDGVAIGIEKWLASRF